MKQVKSRIANALIDFLAVCIVIAFFLAIAIMCLIFIAILGLSVWHFFDGGWLLLSMLGGMGLLGVVFELAFKRTMNISMEDDPFQVVKEQQQVKEHSNADNAAVNRHPHTASGTQGHTTVARTDRDKSLRL